MKRELKGDNMITSLLQMQHPIARPIPMKRELKESLLKGGAPLSLLIARPIPMKRELKDKSPGAGLDGSEFIARPIPMKRELKGDHDYTLDRITRDYRKAHPDEKGTERSTAPPLPKSQ